MLLKEFTMVNCKYLLPNGTRDISIIFTSPVICLIGNNGCGKSTIIKAMTPLPSLAPIYMDGGYEILTFEHNGVDYQTHSTFGKGKGLHSFKKHINGDWVELNPSKTSTVQTELCESELGLSTAIHNLSTGCLNICTMSNTDRRKLLLESYPSNLTFVLDKFKRISSKRKAIDSTLKELKARQAELENLTVSRSVLQTLMDRADMLSKFEVDTISGIQGCKEDCIRLRAMIPEHTIEITPKDIAKLNTRLKKHKTDLRNFKVKCGKVDVLNVKATIGELKQQTKLLEHQSLELSRRGSEIAAEMHKFRALENASASNKISKCETRMAECKKYMVNLDVNPSLQRIPLELCRNKLNDNLFANACEDIDATEGNIVTPAEYTDAKQHYQSNQMMHNIESKRIEDMRDVCNSLEHQMASLAHSKFKEGCKLTCAAREESAAQLSKLKCEYGNIETTIADCITITVNLEKEQEELLELLHVNDSIQPSLLYVLEVLDMLRLNTGTEPFEMAITKPLQLKHMTDAIYVNEVAYVEFNKYESELNELTLHHNHMLTAREFSTENFGNLAMERENSLDGIRAELSAKHAVGRKIQQSTDDHIAVLHSVDEIERCKCDFSTHIRPGIILHKVGLLEETIDIHTRLLAVIKLEQLDIQSTLKTKRNIRIRIDEEIVPFIEVNESKLKNLKTLEYLLSPATGASVIYIVQFLNSILDETNLAASELWNMDIELKPVSLDKKFDYAIAARLSNEFPVPDIRLLSDGQKQLVDLAFTFAMYLERDMGATYPMKLDEIDSGMVVEHRNNILAFLKNRILSGEIQQLIMVNHYAELFTAFDDCQIICIDPRGVALPKVYNENVKINSL